MAYESLKLSELSINTSNDRHGPLGDESTSIGWLFHKQEQHMRNLAQDLVSKREVLEPPLVYKESIRHVVFDGNRRVTCLKTIADPRRAPTAELQEFFKQLSQAWQISAEYKISCRIENDLERIDDILFRRHTGSQNGIGQTTWTDRMKRNFLDRTGRGNATNIADSIERLLLKHGALPRSREMPRSTLSRLLSSEEFRSRVGISYLGSKLTLLHDEEEIIPALQRVGNDLASRSVTLGHLWDATGKHAYLDSLEAEGILPDIENAKKISPSNATKGAKPKRQNRQTTISRSTRKHLIPSNCQAPAWTRELERHRDIWEELQYSLNLTEHRNAIAVLVRVLLELSVDHYIYKHSDIKKYDNEKLSKKIQKASLSLEDDGSISRSYRKTVSALSQGEGLLSVSTLHRYIHSYELKPSPEHLKELWDTVENFVVSCLNYNGP